MELHSGEPCGIIMGIFFMPIQWVSVVNLICLCLQRHLATHCIQIHVFWLFQLILLDFGASRSFSAKFVDDYIRIIKSASEGDREGIKHWSVESGFLTGYETKVYIASQVFIWWNIYFLYFNLEKKIKYCIKCITKKSLKKNQGSKKIKTL